MRKIQLTGNSAVGNAKFVSQDGPVTTFRLPKEKGGINLPDLVGCKHRYFNFYAQSMTDHSVCMKLCFYTTDGEDPCFYIHLGLLPKIRALVCVDMEWVKGAKVFPERNPGQVKIVCLGEHIHADNVKRVTLENSDCFTEIDFQISEPVLTNDYPAEFPIPDVKLIDKFGQYKLKDWPNKIKDEEMLKTRLTKLAGEKGKEATFPFADWNTGTGSYKKLKLTEGSGFFATTKQKGRWWLVDPEGYVFFSTGVDVVVPNVCCRIDGVEPWMDWLPKEDDPTYGKFYDKSISVHTPGKEYTAFAYDQINLQRVFGDDWYEHWLDFIPRFLKDSGINTVGNWSDFNVSAKANMPYVDQLPSFPTTTTLIFRDLPDVFSPEYRESAKQCAQHLKARANDPNLIGYFLRNEPHWAFAANIVVADEVLCCGLETHTKGKLIEFLQERYPTIDNLNKAWDIKLGSFDDLNHHFNGSATKPSKLTSASDKDIREFSRIMLNEYAAVPSQECRKVDPNHMNLGMRWAWITDPDLVAGWENFDVFSINCYRADAVSMMDYCIDAGVDLPMIIGEFQFGALDVGPTATGLYGVKTQAGRAKAYRHYVEGMAAHTHGVGCHYFQFTDQFALGRFDGENYNIGFIDVCTQPYETFINDGVKKSSEHIYSIMQGETPAYSGEEADYIPMIAY